MDWKAARARQIPPPSRARTPGRGPRVVTQAEVSRLRFRAACREYRRLLKSLSGIDDELCNLTADRQRIVAALETARRQLADARTAFKAVCPAPKA